MKQNVKKLIIGGTLLFLGLCAAMLIATIFGMSFFVGTKLSILITAACLTVGGYFSLSSYNVLTKHKVLGTISFILIWASVILVTISGWVNLEGIFGDITLTLALLSVLFNFIVSNTLKLGKHYRAIQVICNIILCLFILLILLSTYGVVKLADIMTIFWLLLVLSVVSFIIMAVLSNKTQGEEKANDVNFVKIPKTEYEELLQKAKQLDELLKRGE